MNSEGLVARDFYIDEARMQLKALLEKIGSGETIAPLHLDVHPNRRELRAVISFGSALEFINFGIDDSDCMIDCSYIMRAFPDKIDAHAVEQVDAEMLWSHLGLPAFISNGKQFDQNLSISYGMKIGEDYEY
jgi:hypothetical protein